MKFLVVGLGSMGKRRVRCLKALDENDIVGFDLRPDRCAEAKTKYGIATVSDWKKAEQLGADVWIISTPPDLHIKYGLMAAKNNIHFFTEANVTDEQTPELIALLAKKKIVGVPSCTLRYFRGPKKIKEIIKAGKIGRPLNFTYHSGQYLPDWHPWESYKDFYVSKRETGACREIVPFELVWLMDIFGNVEKLSCFKDKLSDLEADIDDVYHVLLRFGNGMLGHILVDVIARPAVRLFRVNGSEGSVEWDHGHNKVRLFEVKTGKWEDIDLGQAQVENGYIHPEEPYIEEVADFVAAIRGKNPYPYTFQDDEHVLDLLVRAEESSLRGVHL